MTKTETIKLRLSTKERGQWVAAAVFHEMSLSEWIRHLANESARITESELRPQASQRHVATPARVAKKAKTRR